VNHGRSKESRQYTKKVVYRAKEYKKRELVGDLDKRRTKTRFSELRSRCKRKVKHTCYWFKLFEGLGRKFKKKSLGSKRHVEAVYGEIDE